MMIELAGFFADLPHGDPESPRLRDVIGQSSSAESECIVEYLATGQLVAAVPSPGVDIFDPDAEGVPSPHLLTDGCWVWPADLAYYVRRYGAALPRGLVANAKANGWVVDVGDEVLAAVVTELLVDPTESDS